MELTIESGESDEASTGRVKAIRVAHLLGGQERGGIPTAIANMMRCHPKDRIESRLIVLGQGPVANAEDERFKDFEVARIKKGLRFNLLTVRRLVKYCREHQIDILHTHSIPGNFYGRLAGVCLPSTAVVSSVHARTLDILRSRFRSCAVAKMIHTLNITMHRLSDRMIGVTGGIRDELVANGIPAHKVACIPRGIEMAETRVNQEEIDAARQRWGIDKNAMVVGIVGRLTPVKNHDLFLKACKNLMEKHPDFVILIVGDGPLRTDLEALVADLSIAERVVFTGWINDVYTQIHLMDVLALPSSTEGFPLILLECMACGTPAVATNITDVPWIIEDQKTGIIVPPNDVDALTKGIDQLLSDPEACARMGAMGREDVAKRFPQSLETERTIEAYSSILR